VLLDLPHALRYRTRSLVAVHPIITQLHDKPARQYNHHTRLLNIHQPYISLRASLIIDTVGYQEFLALLSLAISCSTILLDSPETYSYLLGLGSHTQNLRFTVEDHKVMLEQHVTKDLEVAARVALDTTEASL
jgi:hypothetical protein